MLVKVDKDELFRKPESQKATFAQETLKEFFTSGMDCAKVTEWERIGTFSQISSSLRNYVREYQGKIKVKTKKQEIYLLREDQTLLK